MGEGYIAQLWPAEGMPIQAYRTAALNRVSPSFSSEVYNIIEGSG